VEEPGALTLPAQQFHNLIKELPGTELALSTTDDSRLSVSVGESRYQFVGLPADQFPPVPEAPDQPLVEVESRLLREMISKTLFSVADDNYLYPSTNCIFLERAKGANAPGLRLVSTDGHRLTVIERPLPQSEQFHIEEGILIPRKGVAAISGLLAEEEQVGLGLSEKSLALKADHKYLFIRLLEKKFPDYRRIIPKSFAYRFAIKRQTLHDIIRRISLLSTGRSRGILLKLTEGQLEVTFDNPGVGNGRELMPLFLKKGDPAGLPITIGFNARYLLEPLRAMHGDTVYLEINDKDQPCRLMAQDDPNYFGIIMPMSL